MAHPGLLYVAATLLPLASFFLLLTVGGIRFFARRYSDTPLGNTVFQALGGDTPRKFGAYIATGAMGLAFILSLIGFIAFRMEHGSPQEHHAASGSEAGEVEHAPVPAWDGSTTWAS